MNAASLLLQSLSLEVTGTTSDVTPPQLKSVDVGEPVLTANDTGNVVVTARIAVTHQMQHPRGHRAKVPRAPESWRRVLRDGSGSHG